MQATDHIKINADAFNRDDVKRANTKSPVRIKSFDDVFIDVVLYRNGQLVDVSELSRITLEIFDIGDLNAPEPRTETRLVFKEIEASKINSGLSEENIASGLCHASFVLSSEETAVKKSEKWLKICAFDTYGKRSTFARGWIYFDCEPGDFSDFIEGTDRESIFMKKSDAEACFLKKISNLSDVNDIVQTRENISTYTKDEIDVFIADHTHPSYCEKSYADATFRTKSAAIISDNRIVSLEQTRFAEPQFLFRGTGALSCLNAACASVKSRSYLFTIDVKQDWDLSLENSLVVIGDCYFGYGGATVDFNSNGCVGFDTYSSYIINMLNDVYCDVVFNSTTKTVIPKGIYSMAFSLDIGDSSSKGTLYVNGVLKAGRTTEAIKTSNFVPNNNWFNIGSKGYNNTFNLASSLKCNLSRVRVLNRAVTAAEAEDYAKGKEDFSSSDMVVKLDSALSGAEVRDLSGNGNHFALVGSIDADRINNPACANYPISWTSGSSVGAYVGGRATVLALPSNTLSSIKIKANRAQTFKIGNASNATAYSSSLSVSDSVWATLEVGTSTAQALCITPTSAVSADTNINIIIEHRKTY